MPDGSTNGFHSFSWNGFHEFSFSAVGDSVETGAFHWEGVGAILRGSRGQRDSGACVWHLATRLTVERKSISIFLNTGML
jgi:hypothetical protein